MRAQNRIIIRAHLVHIGQLSAGDKILLTLDGRLGLPVVSLELEKALVLGGTMNTKTADGVNPGDPLPQAFYSGINVFVLEADGQGTRLIFRRRLGWNPGFANTLMPPVS